MTAKGTRDRPRQGKLGVFMEGRVSKPSTAAEKSAFQRGYVRVAGLDEVGRGPLAGPVTAAAVVLPWPMPKALAKSGIRDSKMLTPEARERLAPIIQEYALAAAIGMASTQEVDDLNIVGATRLAMLRALEQVAPAPDMLLIDALPLPQARIPYEAIIHGDALCLSIAAASIIAKVARDKLMEEMDTRLPGYGFAHHKGYATEEHMENLRRLGPSPEHRRSFAPVRFLLEGADIATLPICGLALSAAEQARPGEQ